jgi:hypothetical protein
VIDDAIAAMSPLAMTANIPQMIINESMAILLPESNLKIPKIHTFHSQNRNKI